MPGRFRALLALVLATTLFAGCGSSAHSTATRTICCGLSTTGAGRTSSQSTDTGPSLTGGPKVPGAGGKFAGYVYEGTVQTIAGSWRVPTIAQTSRLGKASTWIGAQAPGNAQAPFIQIGTQEEMRTAHGKRRPERFYEAFFSDSHRAYHPYSLFGVHAGDELSATMKLIGQRWFLSVIDDTTGASDHFSTAEEGTGQFNYALWLQEDVTNTKINVAFPYPDLSTARMSELKVNGVVPASAHLLSTWMSLPGGYLGPTSISGGAFSVVPQRLSTAGARYLTVAAHADKQADEFETDVDNWATSTSDAVVQRETDSFVSELKATVASLKAVSWPATVSELLGSVEFNDDYVVQALQLASTGGVVRVYQSLMGLESRLGDGDDTRLIRRGLNVEQLGY